ncbi:MAG: transposase [Candidatus Omnitrophota bacterium]
MSYRKVPLVKNELYHVYNSSIAGFKIFNCAKEYQRLLDLAIFYLLEDTPCAFSVFKKLKKSSSLPAPVQLDYTYRAVIIIAYCIMPTHIHFVLKQLTKDGISTFMNRISQGYAQYFNKKYKRKGPLWEGRFKNVLVDTDNYFEHLTRYIHLNPVTACIVDKPEDWAYSSYREYVGLAKGSTKVCSFAEYLNMDILEYSKFVNDRISYQRELAMIKNLTLD